jgi:kynurenine formamidase
MKAMLSPLLLVAFAAPAFAQTPVPKDKVHDLSLLVASDWPCIWPVGMTPFSVTPTRRIGPHATNRDMLNIDEHTGTQWDAPAHFVPPPDSGLPGAGPNGLVTGEKVPAWQFGGEACVIDVTEFCDRAPNGSSFLIKPEIVQAWEKKHRVLKFGDVVLFKSGYTNRYYKPLAKGGERFVSSALRKESPGWPAPTPETMDYLADRGVMTLGLDGASMGPLPDLAVATHQAGGKRGMVWVECATNLDALPATGSYFALLPAKHAGGSGGECRCIGITEPNLAKKLIAGSRKKQVVDLSVTLHEDFPVTWPGHQPGEEASRYVAKTLNAFGKARGPYFAAMHLLDTQVGTHVVLPSHCLPGKEFKNDAYDARVAALLKKYEATHGPRGTSTLTIDRVPLNELMGRARVIDVRKVVGSTQASDWPKSPVITLELVQRYEAATGAIQPGDVVLFWSGHSDRHFKALPASPDLDPLFAAPLAGKAEGWPTPAPDMISYLTKRGVKCVGTDGPTLGGVNREQALFLNWHAASRGLIVVEFLTGLEAIADKDAFFLFAPIKIRGTTSGYGRAIAIH